MLRLLYWHRWAKVGKADIRTDTFIGVPFGAVFELEEDGKTLRRCARCQTLKVSLQLLLQPIHVPRRHRVRAGGGRQTPYCLRQVQNLTQFVLRGS